MSYRPNSDWNCKSYRSCSDSSHRQVLTQVTVPFQKILSVKFCHSFQMEFITANIIIHVKWELELLKRAEYSNPIITMYVTSSGSSLRPYENTYIYISYIIKSQQSWLPAMLAIVHIFFICHELMYIYIVKFKLYSRANILSVGFNSGLHVEIKQMHLWSWWKVDT